MKTLKGLFLGLCAVIMMAGLFAMPIILDYGWERGKVEASKIYNLLFVKVVRTERVVTVEKEPEYCDGLCGLITRHAKAHGVPPAVAKAVATQEGSQDASNTQVNCKNRYWEKSHRLENCALGMMQLIPAFNDIADPTSIVGPENLERNIELGIKRLRRDFDASAGKNAQARWYNAFIRYYGADQDGYPSKVMALVTKFAVEEG